MNQAAANGSNSGREAVNAVLERRRPERIVYAPNYWQWFVHQQRCGLPPEIAHCRSQLDVIRALGLDVFSRNVYCDQETVWYGGLCRAVWSGVEVEEQETRDGRDRIFVRTYRTAKGTLTERLRYVTAESTLVQEKFLVVDPATELDALEELVRGRRWRFDAEAYSRWAAEVGDDGVVVAGEVFGPLKMLHYAMNPVQTCYLLFDQPERAAELTALHEEATLELVEAMAAAGVPVMMAMDNLDTQFHPPPLVDQYSASFYERASRACHAHGSLFFIHACGQQRENLARIAGLGVDGLEGVAYPPLGDVELDEAMRLTGERFIITGGIIGPEYNRLASRDEVFAYVRALFDRIRPYAHRFMLAASCSTPYTARWETLVHFRDAWREYGTL